MNMERITNKYYIETVKLPNNVDRTGVIMSCSCLPDNDCNMFQSM